MLYEGSWSGPLLIFAQFMRLIAASSLFSAPRTLSLNAKQRLKMKGLVLTTIPGLNCHQETPIRSKSAIFYLKKFLNEEVTIWYDAINNCLSSHQNNYDSPYSGKALANQLKPFSRRMHSITYYQNDGTPNIYRDLKTANLPAVSMTKRYHFKTKEEKQPGIERVSKYRALYQSTTTESKFFFTVLRHKGV